MADAPPLTVITTTAKDTSDAILKSCAALMWSTPEFEWAFDINKGDALCKTEEANITDSRADDSEVQTALQVRTSRHIVWHPNSHDTLSWDCSYS